MSCCDPGVIYVRCGTTLKLRFLDRDKTTKQPIPLTGLSARGSIVDDCDKLVLALDSSHFTVQPDDGDGAVIGAIDLLVASDATQALSPQNERRELKLYVETFDGASPPFVKPFGTFPLVALPDLTP